MSVVFGSSLIPRSRHTEHSSGDSEAVSAPSGQSQTFLVAVTLPSLLSHRLLGELPGPSVWACEVWSVSTPEGACCSCKGSGNLLFLIEIGSLILLPFLAFCLLMTFLITDVPWGRLTLRMGTARGLGCTFRIYECVVSALPALRTVGTSHPEGWATRVIFIYIRKGLLYCFCVFIYYGAGDPTALHTATCSAYSHASRGQ